MDSSTNNFIRLYPIDSHMVVNILTLLLITLYLSTFSSEEMLSPCLSMSNLLSREAARQRAAAHHGAVSLTEFGCRELTSRDVSKCQCL